MKINEEILYRKIEGRFFLVDPKNFFLYSLNEVGSYIWELLKNKIPKSQILKKLKEEYDVDSETLKMDLEEFLQQLKKYGIILE